MRWLLSNVRSRALFAARHPAYAVRSLLREATHADERFLSGITDCPVAKLRGFLDEPLQTPSFAAVLREAEAATRGSRDYGADLFAIEQASELLKRPGLDTAAQNEPYRIALVESLDPQHCCPFVKHQAGHP